jgi:hypothetical protein
MAIADYPTVNGILQSDNNGVQSIVLAPGVEGGSGEAVDDDFVYDPDDLNQLPIPPGEPPVDTTIGWDAAPDTWDTWLNYNVGAQDTLYWITEPVIMERNDYFNIETNIDATGDVEYTVWTSDTGDFDGEETETVITENQQNIAGFFGQYAVLGIKVSEVAANGIVQINRFSWKTTGRTLSFYFNTYNSSDLAGVVGARKVYMPKPASWITNAQITAYQSQGLYVEDDYVDDDYFESSGSGPVITNILERYSDHVEFGFFALDGTATDTVFDAVFQVLPEQYADGPNIRAR